MIPWQQFTQVLRSDQSVCYSTFFTANGEKSVKENCLVRSDQSVRYYTYFTANGDSKISFLRCTF